MSWQGKVIGGSLGSIFGPWGAIAGAAAGHWLVDRKNDHASRQEMLKLLAITAAAYREVARASGPFTHERDAMTRRCLAHINRDLQSPADAPWLNAALENAERIGPGVELLAGQARQFPQLAAEWLVGLWRIASSGGEVPFSACSPINRFVGLSGIDADLANHLAELYIRHRPSTSSAAATDEQSRRSAASLLGVPYSADAETLRRAYRRESLKYHPDQVGEVPPAIRELAAERFSAVKAAYDLLSGASGPEPLDAERWFVLALDSNTLVPPSPGGVVRCFLCAARIRLPNDLAAIRNLRCPTCQALLARTH